jgi:hypothetical protein
MTRIYEAIAGNFVSDFDEIMEESDITEDVIMQQIILRGLEDGMPRGRGVKQADLIEYIRGLKRSGLWNDENAAKRYKTANGEIPINQKKNVKGKGKNKNGGGQNNRDNAPEEDVEPRGDVNPRDERKANKRAEKAAAKAQAKAEAEARAREKAAKAEAEAREKAKAEEEANANVEAEDEKRPLAPSKIHFQELWKLLIEKKNKNIITGNDAVLVSRLTDIRYYKLQDKEEKKETEKKMRELYRKYVYQVYFNNNPRGKVRKDNLKK